jgi:vitamin B12/bleomycin/antimicrobial peptide transport system ATP-binding/permease protein
MAKRGSERKHHLRQGLGGLASAYWRSGERWSASLFTIIIVAVSLSMVGINLLQNIATGSVFTALQESDPHGFYLGLAWLMAAIVVYMFAAVVQLYLRQSLQLRWRRWLTDRYLKDWLARHVFYRMRFRNGIDNPDQRIAEDVRVFIEQTVTLALGLLGSVAALATFAALLWGLSGSLTVDLGRVSIAIPDGRSSVSTISSKARKRISASISCACVKRPKASRSTAPRSRSASTHSIVSARSTRTCVC